MNKYDNWCSKLKDNWINKNIHNIINLFDNNVVYYETPYEKISNIKDVWAEIEGQDILDLSYEILGEGNNLGIAHYILKLDDSIVDMIYEIQLNDEDKCIYFKQYYMIFKNE